jgi:mevalonate kinase
MPAFSATAPGKVILFGEHAVVYGRPAIAVPVSKVKARAVVMAEPRNPAGMVRILAPDIGLETTLASLPEDHPFAVVIHKAAAALGIDRFPACSIQISSTIPIAGGMGSGAAVSAAVLRALSASIGHPLSDGQVSELVYEAEKVYHGTPSGIDNVVITYSRPIYYMKDKPVEILPVKKPFSLVIGDTGLKSPTSVAVGEVRQAWQANPERYEQLFDAVAGVAIAGRKAIRSGKVETLGPLMDGNQRLLQQMGVSSPQLDALIDAAKSAGALGAKLTGAGRGGSMIALVESGSSNDITNALFLAGAAGVIVTEVSKS